MYRFRTFIQLINLFVSTYFFLLVLAVVVTFCFIHISSRISAIERNAQKNHSSFISSILSTPKPPNKLSFLLTKELVIATPSPLPSPTPRPYPPDNWLCIHAPILMYHHVQPREIALQKGQTGHSINPEDLDQQIQTIKQKEYTIISLKMLSDYFDQKIPLPEKPLILTFDDGYADFYTYALPILTKHTVPAELFVPTGLLENPDYLTWNQVKEISTQNVAIGHHTWSHANVAQGSERSFSQEIDGATQQLEEHGYGKVPIFAYPYGNHNTLSEKYLERKGFTIAVTTEPGEIQCREERLKLKRTRVGNGPISRYGI